MCLKMLQIWKLCMHSCSVSHSKVQRYYLSPVMFHNARAGAHWHKMEAITHGHLQNTPKKSLLSPVPPRESDARLQSVRRY